MPTDSVLIPSPVLDPRTAPRRVAERLDRSVGNYLREDAELLRDTGDELIDILDSGLSTVDKLMPELSSVSPAEAHVVILTEMERSDIELQFALNLLPEQNRIALYQIVGIELQAALASTTTMLFTKTAAFLNQDVTIPLGTLIATEDRKVIVATDEALVIPSGTPTGSVSATATVSGFIGRVPVGKVGLLLQSVAGIESVSNTADLVGGRNAETTEQAEIRAREGMRRGIHLSSAADWEDYVFFTVLRRKGRATAFEGYRGDFEKVGLGYLLLIVQDEEGLAPSPATLEDVGEAIAERHVAGIQVTARAADYKDFDLEVDVTVTAGASVPTLTARAETNLREFYSPLTFRFGPNETERFISLSDIVGLIESAGRDQISVKQSAGRFSVRIVLGAEIVQDDVPLMIGELPNLVAVTLNVVP